MKLLKVLSLALCLLALVPQFAFGRDFNTRGRFRINDGAIPNNYIVVFDESVAANNVGKLADALARAYGGTIGFTYESALRGFSVELSEARAAALSRHPQVAFVESDVLVEGAATQTAAPWTLDRLDQREPTLNNSYTYSSDGAGVNAYIVDGGIRMTHQEFGGRAVFAYDNVGDGRNGTDCFGHGTHVAGTIGGATYGVAKGVKLHAVRVLNCSNQALASRVIAGIDWVTANHVKPAVANLSFFTGVGNDAMDLAVRNLIASGVTSVAAAGNNSGDAALRSPARVREAITVAATDQNDSQATFSNSGAVVDVYAPGVDIVSTWSTADDATNIKSGTSYAAPLVTGLVARYLATRPGDQPDAVAQAIMNSATPGKVFNAGAGTPNLLAYAGITLSDNFNDNTRDVQKWNTLATSGSVIVEQNGRLEITPTAAMPGYDGYISATNLDLTDSRISVETIAVPNTNGFATFYGLREPTSGNYLLIAVGSNGALVMQRQVAGVMSQAQFPYNAAQHRFWRFRHNRANDSVNWETSPEGVAWTTYTSLPTPFDITKLQVLLVGQKATAASPTDTVIFDNLWHEPNPTPSVAMADNFNDNLIDPLMWTISDPASPTTVAEQNGRIEVTPQPNTAGYNGLTLAGRFDYRDKTLQVEVEPASQTGDIWTYFGLSLDGNNRFIISTGIGALYCDATVNGVTDRTSLNWDAGMRFWRFRHDIDANTVNFETSADGVTWTTRKTVTAAFALSSLQASIGSGANGATNPTPGMAVFDNFRLERYRPLFPLSDNFNDGVRAAKWNTLATPGSVIVEQNGRLEITPTAAMPGYDGYISATTINLTDARASVETIAVPNTNGFATFYGLREPTSGNYLLIAVGNNGALVMQRQVAGVMSQAQFPYNAAQHRFWRFRHNRANDSMNWETSPEGVAWTTYTSLPTPFDITKLQVLLVGQKATATSPTDTVIFDNLRIERNEGGLTR
jgi:hypothetical protein